VEFIPGYNAFLQEPLQFTGNRLVLNDRPGLGIDLDMDRVKKAVHPQWVF
jgi:L-alanine-DL-glutamate epimerase-like enolase superfamily enzyme